ncbi:MAG: DrmB family protein [Cyanophyceae cyanobacterium]
MPTRKNVKPHGEVRRSQLITTFGPGSMVDLPDHSVIIGGLNLWKGYKQHLIEETRLASKVRDNLIKFGHATQNTQISLYSPPAANDELDTGIETFIFPHWFVVQKPTSFSRNGKDYQSRPLLPYKRLINGKYEDSNRQKHAVVPVRFVQACPNGHLSDIDWYRFVNPDCRSNCPEQLYLEEGGTGNDFSDIFVYCQKCKKRRPLSDAKLPNVPNLGYCHGNMPWLGFKVKEECSQPDNNKPIANRLLVRSASNAYFGQILSAISIPDTNQALKDAVTQVYEKYLKEADSEDISYFRSKLPEVREALEQFEDAAIYAEVKRRRSGTSEDNSQPIKQLELEVLLNDGEQGIDEPDSNFYAEQRSLPKLPNILQGRLNRIVLVKRLREVIALIGFTRFEPINTDIDGELPEEAIDLRVGLAKLNYEVTWVPAVENKGEGVFISFNVEAIKTWQGRSACFSQTCLLNP